MAADGISQRRELSHETIYRSLFLQARGPLKQELVKHLRSKRRIRRSRNFSVHGHSQGYFYDSQSPWQRGSNGNTNGLLRQYLPKNADLSKFSQSELGEIALRLNVRPRQTLGFRTPADKLQASVASTP